MSNFSSGKDTLQNTFHVHWNKVVPMTVWDFFVSEKKAGRKESNKKLKILRKDNSN